MNYPNKNVYRGRYRLIQNSTKKFCINLCYPQWIYYFFPYIRWNSTTASIPFLNISKEKFSLGEWIASDSRPNPINTVFIPNTCSKVDIIGILPGWRTFKISLGEKKKEYVIVDANSALAVDGVTKLRYKRAGIYQKRLVGNGIAKAMVVKNMPKSLVPILKATTQNLPRRVLQTG